VGSRPDDIRVGEIHGRSLIERLGSGAKSAIFGQEQVEYDLLVAGPVAAICKDEDSVYFDLVEVSQAGVIGFVLGELPEGCRVLVVFNNVPGGDYILEAVPFRDMAALLAFAAHDEDSLVLLCHFAHWRVAADELAGGHFHLELPAEV
jgi:hypothetical protein